MELDVSLAGFIVGIVVGLTGMGGGALMTPILVIVFGIKPLAAVSSDLVAAFVMKPIGGGIHWRRGTVHAGLVRWLMLGSIPGALGGSYLVSHLDNDVDDLLQTVLGAILLVAASSMAARAYVGSHRRVAPPGVDQTREPVRRVATVAVGLVGGLIVGVTSVGSGSLMIVALMLLYPLLSPRQLVGTDLVQAVPLVGAAALGHVIWGDLQFDLTGSLLLGSIPGVIIGAHWSSRANDAVVRPLLITVLVLSATKLLGASDELLGALIAVIAVAWLLAIGRHYRRTRRATSESPKG
jgi:hypothetical protein